MNDSDALPPDADITRALEALTSRSLSGPARAGHVVLFCLACAMAVLLAALLVTEPVLALRTQAAFIVMLCIALAWAGYAAWVLRRRHPLLSAHRVVAGRMAVTFSAIFVLGCVWTAGVADKPGLWMGAAIGTVFIAVALILLVRATRQHRALLARRDQLQAHILAGRR